MGKSNEKHGVKQNVKQQPTNNMNGGTDTTEKKELPPALFVPRKQDKLFWALYVMNIGEAEYHMIGNRHKNAELEEI
jgi:hypothetical protein